MREAREPELELAQRFPCVQLAQPEGRAGDAETEREPRGTAPALPPAPPHRGLLLGAAGCAGKGSGKDRNLLLSSGVSVGPRERGWEQHSWDGIALNGPLKVLPTQTVCDSSRGELSLLPSAAPGLPCSLGAPQH